MARCHPLYASPHTSNSSVLWIYLCVCCVCVYVYVGPPQQYPGQEDYYGDQYSHAGQGASEGRRTLQSEQNQKKNPGIVLKHKWCKETVQKKLNKIQFLHYFLGIGTFFFGLRQISVLSAGVPLQSEGKVRGSKSGRKALVPSVPSEIGASWRGIKWLRYEEDSSQLTAANQLAGQLLIKKLWMFFFCSRWLNSRLRILILQSRLIWSILNSRGGSVGIWRNREQNLAVVALISVVYTVAAVQKHEGVGLALNNTSISFLSSDWCPLTTACVT